MMCQLPSEDNDRRACLSYLVFCNTICAAVTHLYVHATPVMVMTNSLSTSECPHRASEKAAHQHLSCMPYLRSPQCWICPLPWEGVQAQPRSGVGVGGGRSLDLVEGVTSALLEFTMIVPHRLGLEDTSNSSRSPRLHCRDSQHMQSWIQLVLSRPVCGYGVGSQSEARAMQAVIDLRQWRQVLRRLHVRLLQIGSGRRVGLYGTVCVQVVGWGGVGC